MERQATGAADGDEAKEHMFHKEVATAPDPKEKSRKQHAKLRKPINFVA